MATFRDLAVIGRRLAEPPTGVGRYLECLLRHWGSLDHPFERIRVLSPAEPRLPHEVFGGRIVAEVIPPRVSPLYWENVQLPAAIGRDALIFAPYTLPWTRAGQGVVSNLGIYSSRPGDFPLLARLRTEPFFKRSVRGARRVIANSTSTKNDVVEYLGADPAKTDVVLLGADERLQPSSECDSLPADVADRYGLGTAPFFLLVGKLSKRRNIPLLIEAFAAAGDLPERLLVVGPDYLGLDPAGLARSHGVEGRVIHRSHAPMEDLAHLYRAATAFVLPTEHEGFSLTIPEAMASGTPAVVFDHAALEGAVRAAAEVVTPPTAQALAEALRRAAEDETWRTERRAAGLEAAKSYRWEETARRTMEILVRASGPTN